MFEKNDTDKYVKYRREFHKYPEPGWCEFRTSARVAQILEEMGYEPLMGKDVVNVGTVGKELKLSREKIALEIERAIGQGAEEDYVKRCEGYPGVIAVFDSGIEGPVTAMRFDMDCLPYSEPEEKGFIPYDEGYISCNKGFVHACGHDMHVAIGLGIADKIINNRSRFKGKIKLIFQPAEETFYGAQSIVDKGHLDDCHYFIALHMALSAGNKPLPSHSIACGCKDFLSDRQIDFYFKGKAAHPAGAAQEGKNALLAACSAALNIHAIAPHEEGLMRVNVGEIYAGVAPNTIAPNALLKVEYRGETESISEYAGRRIFEIIEGSCKAYDMDYDYVDYGEVPSGKSDDEMMKLVMEAAKRVSWFRDIHLEGNVGGSDDATVMMKRVQSNGGYGSYIGIGCDTKETLHNPYFNPDEESIGAAIELSMNILKDIHQV